MMHAGHADILVMRKFKIQLMMGKIDIFRNGSVTFRNAP